MSDSQPTQQSLNNSPPSSPAQSYLTILPSDSVSSTGILLNSRPGVLSPAIINPILLQRSNTYHSSQIGSAASTISDLTDTPSSLLTPTVTSNTIAHSQHSVPEHFLPIKKLRKSWVWDPRHGQEYLDSGKWRWRCQHCK